MLNIITKYNKLISRDTFNIDCNIILKPNGNNFLWFKEML